MAIHLRRKIKTWSLRRILRHCRSRRRRKADESSSLPTDEELSRPSDEALSVQAQNDHDNFNDDQANLQMLLSWRERLHRTIRKIRHRKSEQTKALLVDATSSCHSTTQEEGEDVQSLAKFSISTVTNGPNGGGAATTTTTEPEDYLPKAIDLADVSHVVSSSSFLAVSFDDDYPQLVLQPSTESSSSLGVSFPHPARRRHYHHKAPAVQSPLLSPKSPGTPPWLQDGDQVWKSIDDEEDDVEEAKAPSPMARLAPTAISKEPADWEEEEMPMRWSFDDSVVSFSTQVLQVLQPGEDRPYDEY